MKSTYELAVLYHPDLEIDLEKSEAKVTKVITDNGGVVTDTENWGKRKTAYPVKGHEHAVYVFYTFDVESTSVQKIEATLNITDEVIRFLIVKEDERAEAKAAAFKAKRKVQEEKKEETEEEEK
ncbi:30S ribosomal protein S6 [Candidatus Saccharibacteria bacterium]|nr:30S ribosomal protein S6 [Candidatus Saccharibacteria bacterium]